MTLIIVPENKSNFGEVDVSWAEHEPIDFFLTAMADYFGLKQYRLVGKFVAADLVQMTMEQLRKEGYELSVGQVFHPYAIGQLVYDAKNMPGHLEKQIQQFIWRGHELLIMDKNNALKQYFHVVGNFCLQEYGPRGREMCQLVQAGLYNIVHRIQITGQGENNGVSQHATQGMGSAGVTGVTQLDDVVASILTPREDRVKVPKAFADAFPDLFR